MLTARAEEDDKVKGLQEADDYITKPFSTRELKARILAVLRRVTPGGQLDLIQVNGLCLDPVGHKVTVQGELLDVGPTEFRLLHFFMAHPERVYTREQLLNNVWGQNVYVEERTVDVHIRRLRKALAVSEHDRHVQTVRTVGYRFSTQV
jgi:two-component system phosphate regulon response regulator PhoB